MASGTIENASIVDALYPVGSVYISLNSQLPSILTAGGKTWVHLGANLMLRTAENANEQLDGSQVNASSSGSVAPTTLTVNQIPSHTHQLVYGSGSAANGSGGSFNLYLSGGSSASTQGAGGGGSHTHGVGNISYIPANVKIHMWRRTA